MLDLGRSSVPLYIEHDESAIPEAAVACECIFFDRAAPGDGQVGFNFEEGIVEDAASPTGQVHDKSVVSA